MSKQNFAKSFISEPNKTVEHSPAQTKQNPRKSAESTPLPTVKPTLDFKKEETKTRRVQLLLKPSVYEKLAAAASNANVSVNRVIEELIEKAL